MSTITRWRPKAIGGSTVDYRLAEILRRRYGRGPITLRDNDLDFLDGVAMAGVPTARDLMDAIEQHKEIVVESES